MGRYTNPHIKNEKRGWWDFLLWKIGHYDDPIPPQPPPSDFCYPASPPSFISSHPFALWIGHSTFLISVEGFAFLTDPVWNTHCSPIPLPPFKRRISPPFPLHRLPPITAVLISHNHYDHLDAKTVLQLHHLFPHAEWILPLGLSRWFTRRGIERVRELNWWEGHSSSAFSVTAVPAQHFSGRTLWDKNKTLWNGYVLEVANKRLYFVGDTGYNERDFKKIGAHWPFMDLSLIPIGAYAPKAFMEPMHIGPYEAVAIHREVQSHLSLAMHWKTFRLSDEPPDLPPYDLYLAMKKDNLPFHAFLPIFPGTPANF